MAATANPSYTRRHLASARRCEPGIWPAVHPAPGSTSPGRRPGSSACSGRLAAYERFWLYPGSEQPGDASEVTSRSTPGAPRRGSTSLAVRLLSEYGDRAALFDTAMRRWPIRSWSPGPNSSSSTRCCSPTTRPMTAPDCLAESLRALRRADRRGAVSRCWWSPASRTPSPRSPSTARSRRRSSGTTSRCGPATGCR